MPSRSPLELTPETHEQLTQTILALVNAHLAQVSLAPSGGMAESDAYTRAQALDAPITECGIDGGLDRISEILREGVAASLPTSGAGYLAYVPGGGLVTAAMADLFSGVVNRFTGLASAAPLFCRLEADVLRWLAQEFGYDHHARGLLTSGGSLANFAAVVTARRAKMSDDDDLRRARFYVSSQVHHSVARCVGLAGFPASSVREVAVDSEMRLSPEALADRIAEDVDAGHRPMMVIASAGTTNTGAVDPFHALRAVCDRFDCWLHVDGAYGGAFVLASRGASILDGIETADSIVFDPHKGMFLPYGTGCVLVKDGQRLRAAHREDAEYLEDFRVEDDACIPSPTEYGPELSRDFRGLRLWLPLMLHGAAPFREALDEKLALASHLWEALKALSAAGVELEVLSRPQLSTVCFRLPLAPGETLAENDARTLSLLEQINGRQEVFLSSTRLPDEGRSRVTIRACILSFRTHQREVDALVRILTELLPPSSTQTHAGSSGPLPSR